MRFAGLFPLCFGTRPGSDCGMRITGGMAGRRRLQVPSGLGVRPTPDRVKQAVFNSLGARVESARILELFAGSGALGLECLSRGAARVVAVERSERHAGMIRRNVEQSGLPRDRFELRTQDAFAVVRQLAAAGDLFDLILADPPFGPKNLNRRSESLSQQLLDDVDLPRLLAPEGLFVLGHAHRDQIEIPAPWVGVKALHHGDSVMTFVRRV